MKSNIMLTNSRGEMLTPEEEIRKELFEAAKEEITRDKNIVFIEDVAIAIGVSKSKFYYYIPATTDEFKELKELLRTNKIVAKKELRKKWMESDNPTLNLCLYKLLSNEHERDLLADRVKSEGQNTNFNLNAEDEDKYKQLLDYVNNWNKNNPKGNN